MPRQQKGVSPRKSRIIDPHRYFVIASEGADTERIYFEGIQTVIEKDFSDRLIKIEFLERKTEKERTKSGHKTVLKQLDKYKKQYNLDKKDELWLVIDRDKGNNQIYQIAEIAKLCEQKSYFLALSNPNIELWLLLHLKDLSNYTEEKLASFFKNEKVNNSRKALEKELSDLLGGFDKSKYKFEQFLPFIPQAIERAKKLDTDSTERWIEDFLGTRIYILVERIFNFV